MTEAPLIVELDGPSCSVAVTDVHEAASLALRAAGAPAVSGLRVGDSARAHMRRDDDEAPPGMRADPYWAVCGPAEPGAVPGWRVLIDVSNAAVGPDAEAKR
jgi:hypothetical protein